MKKKKRKKEIPETIALSLFSHGDLRASWKKVSIEDREILVVDEVWGTVTHKFSEPCLSYARSVSRNLSGKWRRKRFFDVGVENDI